MTRRHSPRTKPINAGAMAAGPAKDGGGEVIHTTHAAFVADIERFAYFFRVACKHPTCNGVVTLSDDANAMSHLRLPDAANALSHLVSENPPVIIELLSGEAIPESTAGPVVFGKGRHKVIFRGPHPGESFEAVFTLCPNADDPQHAEVECGDNPDDKINRIADQWGRWANAETTETTLPPNYTPAFPWKVWANFLGYEDYRPAKRDLLAAVHPEDVGQRKRKVRIDRAKLSKETADKLTKKIAGRVR